MNAKSYFRYTANLIIAINLIIGLSSIFLVERLLPAVRDILDDNATSMHAILDMGEALARHNEQGKWANTESEVFWQAVKKLEKNISFAEEQYLLADIKELGEQYFSGSLYLKADLSAKINEFARLNLDDIATKDKKIHFQGTSGAWTIGFLALISVILQLIFKSRIISIFMDPLSDFLLSIREYCGGNLLRRFNNPHASEELKDTGRLLTVILDENMDKRKLNPTLYMKNGHSQDLS